MATTKPGERVRKLREQAELSRDELADLAGVGQSGRRNGNTIGSWENGGGTNLETAQKVVEALADKLNRQRADVLAYIVWG